jgi:hypothetical protein
MIFFNSLYIFDIKKVINKQNNIKNDDKEKVKFSCVL